MGPLQRRMSGLHQGGSDQSTRERRHPSLYWLLIDTKYDFDLAWVALVGVDPTVRLICIYGARFSGMDVYRQSHCSKTHETSRSENVMNRIDCVPENG